MRINLLSSHILLGPTPHPYLDSHSSPQRSKVRAVCQVITWTKQESRNEIPLIVEPRRSTNMHLMGYPLKNKDSYCFAGLTGGLKNSVRFATSNKNQAEMISLPITRHIAAPGPVTDYIKKLAAICLFCPPSPKPVTSRTLSLAVKQNVTFMATSLLQEMKLHAPGRFRTQHLPLTKFPHTRGVQAGGHFTVLRGWNSVGSLWQHMTTLGY